MSDDAPAKVLVKRPSKIRSDGHGRSVWADPVESAELELVSTQTLKQILSSNDDKNRKSIADLATTAGDGVLVRDPATGMFKIIDDEELQQILDDDDSLPKLSRPSDATLEPLHDYSDDDHLSLVSTQALRRILPGDESDKDEVDDKEEDAIDTGFNPYDSG